MRKLSTAQQAVVRLMEFIAVYMIAFLGAVCAYAAWHDGLWAMWFFEPPLFAAFVGAVLQAVKGWRE